MKEQLTPEQQKECDMLQAEIDRLNEQIRQQAEIIAKTLQRAILARVENGKQ